MRTGNEFDFKGRIAGGVHCAHCENLVTTAYVRRVDLMPLCEPCYDVALTIPAWATLRPGTGCQCKEGEDGCTHGWPRDPEISKGCPRDAAFLGRPRYAMEKPIPMCRVCLQYHHHRR